MTYIFEDGDDVRQHSVAQLGYQISEGLTCDLSSILTRAAERLDDASHQGWEDSSQRLRCVVYNRLPYKESALSDCLRWIRSNHIQSGQDGSLPVLTESIRKCYIKVNYKLLILVKICWLRTLVGSVLILIEEMIEKVAKQQHTALTDTPYIIEEGIQQWRQHHIKRRGAVLCHHRLTCSHRYISYRF